MKHIMKRKTLLGEIDIALLTSFYKWVQETPTSPLFPSPHNETPGVKLLNTINLIGTGQLKPCRFPSNYSTSNTQLFGLYLGCHVVIFLVGLKHAAVDRMTKKGHFAAVMTKKGKILT